MSEELVIKSSKLQIIGKNKNLPLIQIAGSQPQVSKKDDSLEEMEALI